MIEVDIKREIAELLTEYIGIAGSAKKAAATIGVSNAVLSWMTRAIWDKVSDDMWRTVASAIGYKFDRTLHADTEPYLAITETFEDARMYKNVFGVICKEGSGKSYSKKRFYKNKNVLRFDCKRHTTAKELLNGLLKSAGKLPVRGHVSTIIERLVNVVSRMENPLIIIDEIEKTKNDVLYLIIDIYNALEGKCGMVFLGTPYFKKRIDLGVERGSMCFPEILSRLGGKFIEIPSPTAEDVKLLVKANGITDADLMYTIVNDCYNVNQEIDMRRADRLVHAHTRPELAAA